MSPVSLHFSAVCNALSGCCIRVSDLRDLAIQCIGCYLCYENGGTQSEVEDGRNGRWLKPTGTSKKWEHIGTHKRKITETGYGLGIKFSTSSAPQGLADRMKQNDVRMSFGCTWVEDSTGTGSNVFKQVETA